jgi:hypothetical protein
MIERAGLMLPLMYRLGYHNANCIGCVKGGAGYWNKIRRDFPEDFEEMAQIEESIGPGARLLRHRSGPLKGQRFYPARARPWGRSLSGRAEHRVRRRLRVRRRPHRLRVRMIIAPITLREANAFIDQHHRHNAPVRGWRFGVSVRMAGALLASRLPGGPSRAPSSRQSR